MAKPFAAKPRSGRAWLRSKPEYHPRTRLAAAEQNVSDITGSVTKQLAAVKAAAATPWPADAKPEPITVAEIAPIVLPAAGFDEPVLGPPQTLAVSAARPEARPPAELPSIAAPATKPREYGVDLGCALSIQVLHARRLGIRSAHPQLFETLMPIVTLREIPKAKRAELHLIAGPLPSTEAAARLCLRLAPYRLYCHPTVLGPDRVAPE